RRRPEPLGTRRGAGRARPRLAHRDARRRALPRGALRAVSRGAALHAAPRARQHDARHRAATHRHLVRAASAARRGALPPRAAPLPLAVRRFDLTGYDLIVSMSHCVAKGVRVPPGALHLSYCFTPMRYVWDLYAHYVDARAGLATRLLAPPVAAALRRWDRRTASVQSFAAISHHIADRIRRVYGREADVIYPPVDV